MEEWKEGAKFEPAAHPLGALLLPWTAASPSGGPGRSSTITPLRPPHPQPYPTQTISPQLQPPSSPSKSPWIANYGLNAAMAGVTLGADALRNAVVAVTSWGFVDTNIKVQGASWFGQNVEFPQAAYGGRGSGNIGKLMFDACDNPAASGWMLQSKGFCT